MRCAIVLAALSVASTAHAQAPERDPQILMNAIHEGAQHEGRMKPIFAVLGVVGASMFVVGPTSAWLTWQKPAEQPIPASQIEYTIASIETTAIGVGAIAIAGMSLFKRNPLGELEVNYAHLLHNDALSLSTRYDTLEAALRRAAMQEKQSRINRGLVMIACTAGLLLGGLIGTAYALDPKRTDAERNTGFVFSGLSFAGTGLGGVLTALMFAIPEPVEMVWRRMTSGT